MANPLQPKVIALLTNKYNAYVINLVGASVAGHMDLICSINGLFYGFEIKWKNDRPSELQKEKINKLIDKGGRAYFIRSTDDVINIMENNIKPIKYDLNNHFEL